MRERLYRSRSDRMLLGVAGGMADWFDLDPSLVRLVWALLVIAGGIGIPLYIVAAIVIPEEPLGASAGSAATASPAMSPAPAAADDDWATRRAARRAARAERGGNGSGAILFGLVLIALGAWFLISRFLKVDSDILVPGLLILLGGVLVVGAVARSGGR